MEIESAMSENAKDPPSEYQLIGPAEDGTIGDLLAGKSAKESRQRLQALIAKWLRMENSGCLDRCGNLGEFWWQGHERP